MRKLKLIPRIIIKRSFRLSVRTIEQFYDLEPYQQQVDQLRNMPAGTLGNDIAKCLDQNKLSLVPKFESHDLKHVLLEFKMTPLDEIRMQAFMLGNGNYSLPCLAILLFGMLLLPARWSLFFKDFMRGRNTMPISEWTIEEYADHRTYALRDMIKNKRHYSKPVMTMQNLVRYGAFALMIAGGFGMLVCLPFLFSSSIADLVGAGFPFVGGAILLVGGLIALSMSTQQKMAQA